MKVLVNGGLNLSELDGWWAEAFRSDLGWALGDGREHPDVAANDRREAEMLYALLEQEIVPEFYERDSYGIPRRWVARIRASMAQLTPAYSSNRMLREYVEHYYHPLAERFAHRAAHGAAAARDANARLRRVAASWHKLRIEAPRFTPAEGGVTVEAHAYLDDLDPDEVAVELYADPLERGRPGERFPLERREALVGTSTGYRYAASFRPERPLEAYTLRIRPASPETVWPLEGGEILWQR